MIRITDDVRKQEVTESELERMVAEYPADSYVDAVVNLAEQSERTYLAAINAGHVVYGFSDSTNY